MRRLRVCLLLLACAPCYAFSQRLSVGDLTCEYEKNPIGLDVPVPRLSWKLASVDRDVMQSAYEIRVGGDSASVTSGESLIWQTGKVMSERSLFVEYGGPPLESKKSYVWQVRVWDNHGNSSAWSTPCSWEMGLLRPSDWLAKWIEPVLPNDSAGQPAPMLRRSFALNNAV
ncbi:MAG TPA: alpha-L-rhamnosidase, partial [Bacteroidota bacterium]|nr:alpha-L-rhamnosidase [Bacteroidota bacterium]